MDNDVESEMQLIERDWKRRSECRYKEGFVEGSLHGQKQSVQTAFNAGFKQGFLSNFLLGKIEGILNALIAYQVNYEGHPITDSTIIEAHSLLETVHSVQTNYIAEDFLKLSLEPHSSNRSVPDDILQKFSSISTRKSNVNNEDDHCESEEHQPSMCVDLHSMNNLDVQQVNDILVQCPTIKSLVDRCKCILKCLKWSDDMIDQLL